MTENEQSEVEVCPKCFTAEFDVIHYKGQSIGPTIIGMPDAYARQCKSCGERWYSAEFLRWADQVEKEREAAAVKTVGFAGAVPYVVDCPGEGQRYYATPNDPPIAIPALSVLLFPNGQCGVVTEKDATSAMRAALSAIAKEEAYFVTGRPDGQWDDPAIALFHARIVRRLRTAFNVGNVRRLPDGKWDFHTPENLRTWVP